MTRFPSFQAAIPVLLAVSFWVLTGWIVYRLLSAMEFAERHGCRVNEGSVTSCVVDGVEHGERLYSALVGPWFAFMTVPIAIACTVWSGFTLVSLRKSKTKT